MKENHALLEQLEEAIGRRHLLQHPFYRAWTAGTLEPAALRRYAAEYYQHVRNFPECLRALAARSDGELRRLVEENLAEEMEPGAEHPRLWRQFAAAVGASDAELDSAEPLPETRALTAAFSRLCREGSPAAAVAALYAYEAQVPEIAAEKIRGLRQHYGVKDARGLAYFAVHQEADVRHRAAWRAWLAARPAEETAEAVAGAGQALEALWRALDGVTPAACRS